MEVINQLLNEGLTLVKTQNELSEHSRSICLLHKDFLAFSPGCCTLLDKHYLVEEGFLALQVMVAECVNKGGTHFFS